MTPAERLALVLHDMFGLWFEENAPVLDISPVTESQLACPWRPRKR